MIIMLNKYFSYENSQKILESLSRTSNWHKQLNIKFATTTATTKAQIYKDICNVMNSNIILITGLFDVQTNEMSAMFHN